jgi:hypothetical protein
MLLQLKRAKVLKFIGDGEENWKLLFGAKSRKEIFGDVELGWLRC